MAFLSVFLAQMTFLEHNGLADISHTVGVIAGLCWRLFWLFWGAKKRKTFLGSTPKKSVRPNGGRQKKSLVVSNLRSRAEFRRSENFELEVLARSKIYCG
jgi:hypothetical protein